MPAETAITSVNAKAVVAARVVTEAVVRRCRVVLMSLERSRRLGTSTSLSVYLPSLSALLACKSS
jgi:hypothetical protein